MGREMPDWPSLWEREPGLRPAGVIVKYGGGDDAGYNVRTNRVGWEPVPEEIAAALCRDRAVRWMALIGVLLIAHDRDSDAHAIYLDPRNAVGFGTRLGPFKGPTLDDALFAACKAVLDARKENHDGQADA